MSLPNLAPRTADEIRPSKAGARGVSVTAKNREYRSDIDGLRAIAIVLVLLSHLGIRKTAGGFVGVDIFFVISGYLLTGNIANSIAGGTFSVSGFYERRVRRIFPALIVMLAITSILAYFVFPSRALILFAHSLLAALFSYSNFYFFTQPDGYFSLTFTKLLLHTWSLGVEEQFYVVLPLCMLWAAKRAMNATRLTIAGLGFASFGFAAYLAFADQKLAFYMPYTRAWELLLGSALALRMIPAPLSRAVREAMAALATLLIFACLLVYSEATPFPGIAAVPPCCAAAMLILLGEAGRTTVSSFLFWRPVVFIGVISYSLYLWHWPVILFLRLGIVPRIDYGPIHSSPILAMAFSIGLAVISWRFVERPFRAGRWKRMPRLRVFWTAGASAAMMTAVAALFIYGRGLPYRFSSRGDAIGNYVFGDSTKRPECFVEQSFATFDASQCLKPQAGIPNVLLLGDSHADALWPGLSRSLPQANVLQATASSCPPVKGDYHSSPCSALRRFVYENYLTAHHVDMVIMSEAWKSPSDIAALRPALRWFHGRAIPVFIVGPVPEYAAPLPLLLALSEKWHVPRLAEHRLLTNGDNLDRQLGAESEREPGVHYASAWQALCVARRCRQYADDKNSIPMLFDSNHLTAEGATLLVQRLQAARQLPLR